MTDGQARVLAVALIISSLILFWGLREIAQELDDIQRGLNVINT